MFDIFLDLQKQNEEIILNREQLFEIIDQITKLYLSRLRAF